MEKENNKDNSTLHYELRGDGDITLLFVHGLFADSSYWKAQSDYFSREYTVVTVDLPGHGASANSSGAWSIERFGEDLAALIGRLDLHNLVLIGHSMGAQVVLETADAWPQAVKGIIAIDFFKNAGTPMTPEIQAQADGLVHDLHQNFADTAEKYVHMVLVTPQTDKEVTGRIVRDFRKANQDMGKLLLPAVFNYAMRERALLQKLPVKLYLINVDYMPTNEAPLKEYTAASYHITHMPGTSHYPMIENPDLLNQLLEETIKDISQL